MFDMSKDRWMLYGILFLTLIIYLPAVSFDFAFDDEAIIAGNPIRVFNHGDMERDFTYIDDIVAGVLAVTDAPPADSGEAAPHRIYNIGNNHPEPLLKMIDLLEAALGRKATRQMEPMQPGDVRATYADIEAISRDHGFSPTVPLEEGIERFASWYKRYHGLN